MATTSQHIATRNDPDLLERFVAAAEQAGITSARSWVEFNMGQLATVKVDGEQTVADVYAYAMEVRQNAVNALPPLPGINPGAVTDAHLVSAISAVHATDPTTTP